MRQLLMLLIVALAFAGCGSDGSESTSGSARRIPVTIIRLDGKKIEPGYRFDNGLRIIEPKPSSTFMAGTMIPVIVEPTNGFAPREVWISSPYEWKDCATTPYKAELKIPTEYLGPLQVCANGQNHQKDIATAQPVDVMITPPSKLIGMQFYLEPHALSSDVIPSRNIVVIGKFANGVDRHIGDSSMTLKYTIDDPSIVSLEGRKLVYKSPGKTRVTATCERISISSDVFAVSKHTALAAMIDPR